jgi:DNA primase
MTFDHEMKRTTMENVRYELVKTGELLRDAGCNVKVVRWKGQKGCDDFIVNNGSEDWDKRLDLATPLQWTAQQHYASEYRKLSAWVQKENGKAPDQRKLDIALAIACHGDRHDAAQLLAYSPAIKNASADEAKAYLIEVCREAVKVKERIEAPRIEQPKPIIRMRI